MIDGNKNLRARRPPHEPLPITLGPLQETKACTFMRSINFHQCRKFNLTERAYPGCFATLSILHLMKRRCCFCPDSNFCQESTRVCFKMLKATGGKPVGRPCWKRTPLRNICKISLHEHRPSLSGKIFDLSKQCGNHQWRAILGQKIKSTKATGQQSRFSPTDLSKTQVHMTDNPLILFEKQSLPCISIGHLQLILKINGRDLTQLSAEKMLDG